MTGIGGPGGIGGPKGPGGPERPEGTDELEDVRGDVAVDRTGGAGRAAPGNLDAITADLAAGRLTPHEAVDRLVDQIAGDQGLPAADRAELRELLTDLVANDPYLTSLAGRL